MTKEVDIDFKDLTPEQMEKAKACTTVDELVALAKNEGVELTDEQLEAISGGGNWLGCWVKDCKDFVCKELE